MHDDLVIPASYDVWLTKLKHHLDRKPGSKAELAPQHCQRFCHAAGAAKG